MSVEKELKKLPTSELYKCEGCGSYHPLSECEVVIIRMIKGKDCELTPIRTIIKDSFNLIDKPDDRGFVNKEVSNGQGGIMVERTEPVVKKLPSGEISDPDGVGRHIPPAEMEEINKKKHSIVPSAFRGLLVDPGQPNFEEKGDKTKIYK